MSAGTAAWNSIGSLEMEIGITSRWARNVRRTSAFVAFVLLGLPLSYLLFPVFERYGLVGAILIVVAAPLALVIFVFAIPNLLQSVRSVAARFTWWHWLLLLLFVSNETFRVRSYQEARAQPLDAWGALRIIPEVVVAIVLGLRVASGKTSLKRLFTGLPGALVLFSLIGIASTSWSVYPAWTLYKSIEYLLDVTVLVAILDAVHTPGDYVSVLDWTLTVYALETLTAWAGTVLWPATAWDSMGRLQSASPSISANSIGTTGAALALVAISRLLSIDGKKSDRSWYAAVLVFGIVSMIAAQTRNAIGGFLFGLPFVLILAGRKWIAVALATVVIPLLLLTSAGNVVETYLERQESRDVLVTATGRTDMWKVAWEQLGQHPLTGLGAYAGGKFGVLAKLNLNNTYLHSDWVEIAVGTSFWGVIVFLTAVLGAWWFLFKCVRNPRSSLFERQLAIEAVGILALLSIHSFFNNDLSYHPPLMFLAVLGYAELLRCNGKRQPVTRMQQLAYAQYHSRR
jgi:O-antigen ligase